MLSPFRLFRNIAGPSRFGRQAMAVSAFATCIILGEVASRGQTPPADQTNAGSTQPTGRRMRFGQLPQTPCVVVPDAPRIATLYANGSRVYVPVEDVWRPMCFSQPGALSEAQLMGIAANAMQEERRNQEPDPLPRFAPPDDGNIAGGGLTIDFDIDPSVPPQAEAALDRVAAYFRQQFDDDITVTVNIQFDGSLPGGVLGATSTSFTNTTWNASRNGLRNGMDESDRIQDHLPAGSTIPVRYNGNSAFITAETRVFWTIANYKSTIGFIGGDAGSLRFNDNINWDYDPDNGVSGYSFVDVVIHEVGHAMGFGSGVDFRDHDIEALDIFRFQRTDGAFDYNPDSYAEFATTPRLCDKNLPNNDVVSDIISSQYKMEDGIPYQASHFYDKSPPIGIMDPVLGLGQTFAPKFLTPADKRMFDAIGWDR